MKNYSAVQLNYILSKAAKAENRLIGNYKASQNHIEI